MRGAIDDIRVLTALLCASALGCKTSPAPEGDPLAHVAWPEATIDWSRPLPGGDSAPRGYVGSAACQPCHARLAESYARHSMARSGMRPLASLDQRWLAGIFDTGSKASVRHARSGYSYRPLRRGSQYFVEEQLLAADGSVLQTWTQPVTHAYSAGSYGMAFYFRQGDKLYQTPLDYYAQRARWDLDPSAMGGNPRFSLRLGRFCVSCHSDYPAQRPGAAHTFEDPLPAGIGCERCHGPGERHVETTRREDIVNPARLPPARRLDVCTQCHLSSWSTPRAGRHAFSFRPGQAMDAYRVNFVAEVAEPDRFKLLGHSERLVRSACFRRSAGQLVCTTCHDPHKSSLEQPAAWWDGKCMSCHAGVHDAGSAGACTESAAARAARGGHCAACHMRAGPPVEQPLLTVTDHYIQRRPPPVRPGPEAKPARLLSWSALLGEPLAGDDLEAVEAVAQANAGHEQEAVRLAARALPRWPDVPELYEWLAGRYRKLGRADTAVRVDAAALRLQPDSRLLPYALAMLDRGTEGAAEEATRALDRMLALDPQDVGALETRGLWLFRRGRVDEATPLLKRAAELGPMAARARVGLAALALKSGRRAEAIAELEAARRIEPRDAWVLEQLAASYAKSGDRKRAEQVARARQLLSAGERGPSVTFASSWLPTEWRGDQSPAPASLGAGTQMDSHAP
jgi:Flp pilus assembly protein TadD